jgi:predicted negative regulator of RcsB-dependent stress response
MTTNHPDIQTEKQIRSLWAEHKRLIIGSILAMLLGVMGISAYQQHQQRVLGQAAAAYYLLVPAFQQSDVAPALEQLHDIQTRYPESIYAALSTLHAIKHYVAHQQYDEAIHACEWIEAHSKDLLPVVAKLKRARLYIAQNKAELALAITKNNPHYRAENALIEGDAHLALKHVPQARAAYKQAMQYASHRQQYDLKNLASMKYNDLNMVNNTTP